MPRRPGNGLPPKHRMRDDPGVEIVVAAAGSFVELARFLRISPAAVRQWIQVPAGRVIEIAQHYRLDPHELRPDLYPSGGWRRDEF